MHMPFAPGSVVASDGGMAERVGGRSAHVLSCPSPIEYPEQHGGVPAIVVEATHHESWPAPTPHESQHVLEFVLAAKPQLRTQKVVTFCAETTTA